MSDAVIQQNTISIAVKDKFPHNPAVDDPNRIVQVREFYVSSDSLPEEYLCIFIDGVEKACFYLK